jgi:hypothetical protein
LPPRSAASADGAQDVWAEPVFFVNHDAARNTGTAGT